MHPTDHQPPPHFTPRIIDTRLRPEDLPARRRAQIRQAWRSSVEAGIAAWSEALPLAVSILLILITLAAFFHRLP